jgi:hypothetical protein
MKQPLSPKVASLRDADNHVIYVDRGRVEYDGRGGNDVIDDSQGAYVLLVRARAGQFGIELNGEETAPEAPEITPLPLTTRSTTMRPTAAKVTTSCRPRTRRACATASTVHPSEGGCSEQDGAERSSVEVACCLRRWRGDGVHWQRDQKRGQHA